MNQSVICRALLMIFLALGANGLRAQAVGQIKGTIHGPNGKPILNVGNHLKT